MFSLPYEQTMSGAQRTKSGKSARNGKHQPVPPLRIEDVASARTNSNGEEAAKCDNDVRELQRASKVSESNAQPSAGIKRFFLSSGNQSQQSSHYETDLRLGCIGDS